MSFDKKTSSCECTNFEKQLKKVKDGFLQAQCLDGRKQKGGQGGVSCTFVLRDELIKNFSFKR